MAVTTCIPCLVDHGYLVVIWAIVPALLVFVLWSSLEKPLLTSSIMSHLPTEYQGKSADELSLVTNRIHNLANDPAQLATADPTLKAAAEEYQQMQLLSNTIKTVLVLALAIAGIFIGLRYVKPKTRARNQVEIGVVQYIMIGCASIAILTTVGIVFSVLFESIRFFGHVNIFDFIFGTHWSPQTALRADQAGSSGAFAVPSIRWYVADLLHRFTDCSAIRFDVGDLLIRICQPHDAGLRKTCDGNSGWYSNRGLRLLCRTDGCPDDSRTPVKAWV